MSHNDFIGLAFWATLIVGILATAYGASHREKSVPLQKPFSMDEYRTSYSAGYSAGYKVGQRLDEIHWGGCSMIIFGLIMLGLCFWLVFGRGF